MKSRTLIHLISVALLLLWGAILLYFYSSGRIIQYLPPDGIFQPMVLVAGIGLVILGLFNLLTIRATEVGCEGHDHDHTDGCCGGDHGTHPHEHAKEIHAADHPCCDHGHDHDHGHSHSHSDHDHAHSHSHSDHDHTHSHSHDDHDHAHGILDESGWVGRLVAISILALPITLAALNSPDQFSSNAIANKGLYNPNYSSTGRADEFSLKKATTDKPGNVGSPTPVPAIADLPPATTDAGTPPGPTEPEPPASEPSSYGSFTLADLEAQVPRSSAGNFILEVPEIYYTGGDIEVQGVLKGQSVETIAQVLPEKVNNEDGHRLRIFRLLVQCCAADARPYSIPVDFGKEAPTFEDMTWVKVTGTMDYQQEGGQTVPLLKALSIEETTAPDEKMIY